MEQTGPLVLVRTYSGKNQRNAAKAFSKDAAQLAGQGYEPVSQSWAPAKRGCLMTLILGFWLAWAFPGKGQLTVTYRLAR
jgi:hypothetical protein